MMITFIVGGQIYQVSKDLLLQYPNSMLCMAISDDDEYNEPIYIERNGHRFQYVLDYIRDRRIDLPTTISPAAFFRDMEYYGFRCCDHDIYCPKELQYLHGMQLHTITWDVSCASVGLQFRNKNQSVTLPAPQPQHEDEVTTIKPADVSSSGPQTSTRRKVSRNDYCTNDDSFSSPFLGSNRRFGQGTTTTASPTSVASSIPSHSSNAFSTFGFNLTKNTAAASAGASSIPFHRYHPTAASSFSSTNGGFPYFAQSTTASATASSTPSYSHPSASPSTSASSSSANFVHGAAPSSSGPSIRSHQTAQKFYGAIANSPSTSSTTWPSSSGTFSFHHYPTFKPSPFVGRNINTASSFDTFLSSAPPTPVWYSAIGTIGFMTGIHYWNIKMMDDGEGTIMIGVIANDLDVTDKTNPYNERCGVGYSARTGKRCMKGGIFTPFGPAFTKGDVIGTLLNMNRKTVTFYKNGIRIGTAANRLDDGTYYACVSFSTVRQEIRSIDHHEYITS